MSKGMSKVSAAFFRFLMLVVGLIILGGSAFFANQTLTYVRASVPTQGTVVKMRAVHSRRQSHLWAPIFVFKDAAGHSFTIISHSSSYPASYSVGDTVPVLYRPDDPQHAKIDTFMNLWAGDLIGMAVGGLFTVLTFWGSVWRSNSASGSAALTNDGSRIVRG